MMCPSLCLWISITVLGAEFVRGDYVVEVNLQSYSNPTNEGVGQGGDCCDPGPWPSCLIRDRRCDNYFAFCLRALSIQPTERGCKTSQILSEVALNGAHINFTQSTVLGLSNPLHLNDSGLWEGIQLYIEVIDWDNSSNSTIQDELIDSYAINISTFQGVQLTNTPGTYGYGRLTLTTIARCAQFFSGSLCQSINVCERDEISCTERGTCMPLGRSNYTCACELGFTGVNCEYCVEQNCSLRGVCTNLNLSCDCDPGYTGSVCESDINECEGQNCSENGQCIDGLNSYSCDCNSGFTGVNCETNIDDCVGQDCSGNGQCVDGINSYNCTCRPGFTGSDCETNIDDCIGQDCSGNGQCLDGINRYRCKCEPGFTGTHCERFNYCAGVSCNGNGQCFNRENNFTCLCEQGFTGTVCNVVINAEGEPNLRGAVGGLAGGLALLIIVIILLLVIVAFLVRRKRALNNHVYETTSVQPVPLDVEHPLDSQQEAPNIPDRESHSKATDKITFDNTIYDSVQSVNIPS